MEHLSLPRDVTPPGPSLVPFVCKSEYDGGPFLTYSARLGLSSSVAHEILVDLDYVGRTSRIPLPELESVVQTWFFFGLLTEVLGKLFKPSEYVRSVAVSNSLGGHDQVLDTSKLVQTVTLWMQQVHEAAKTKEESRRQHEHIPECLWLVETILSAARPLQQPNFNPSIKWSIASISELLSRATDQVFAIENPIKDNSCPSEWVIPYEDPGDIPQMLRGGYCPSEIQYVRKLSFSIQTYHLLLSMDRTGPSAQHQLCTDEKCRAQQINPKRYAAKHQRDGCQCDDLLVDVEEVTCILSRGVLPLLRLTLASQLSNLSIDVVAATPTSKYVAISHVWADGLGNPYCNALPRCQLQHLYQIVRSLLENQTNNDPGEVVFLWIDTLCCPVEPPEAKKMALNQIRTPYIEASHVLVLDSSLQTVDLLGLAPEEICMRIFTSGWMRRLWTLQEGALPRHLWFQFKNLAVNLDAVFYEAFNKIYQPYKLDVSRSALLLDIVNLRIGLRGFFHAEENMPSRDIASVYDALRFRSVTVPTDEPLLIGGLLNFDLAQILDGPVESRMQRVWTLVSLAPGGIPKTDPDASSRPASLHTFLKDASQTRRLLLASAVRFEASREILHALLVHDVTELHRTNGPRQVISDTIVLISKQEKVDQILLEAAYQASRSLLDDEITARYADLAVEDEEEQRQNPVYADLELRLKTRIIALAESLDFGNLRSLLSEEEIQLLKFRARSLIVSFYFGEYCILGPMLFSETEWCVD